MSREQLVDRLENAMTEVLTALRAGRGAPPSEMSDLLHAIEDVGEMWRTKGVFSKRASGLLALWAASFHRALERYPSAAFGPLMEREAAVGSKGLEALHFVYHPGQGVDESHLLNERRRLIVEELTGAFRDLEVPLRLAYGFSQRNFDRLVLAIEQFGEEWRTDPAIRKLAASWFIGFGGSMRATLGMYPPSERPPMLAGVEDVERAIGEALRRPDKSNES